MDAVPVLLPGDAKPGSVVELYTAPDGTMAAQVRIPARSGTAAQDHPGRVITR